MNIRLLSAIIIIGLKSITSYGQVTAAIALGWVPATDHDSNIVFKLYQGTASGVYPMVFDVGSITNYTVPNLVPGTQYYFIVTAVNQAGLESLPSNELVVAMPTTELPSLVTLFEVNRNENRTLLSWAPSPATEAVFTYEIQYKTDLETDWTILLTDKTANNSITTDSTSIYTVQVRAVGPAGPGPWLIRTLPGIVPRIVQSLYISPKSQITYTYKP